MSVVGQVYYLPRSCSCLTRPVARLHTAITGGCLPLHRATALHKRRGSSCLSALQRSSSHIAAGNSRLHTCRGLCRLHASARVAAAATAAPAAIAPTSVFRQLQSDLRSRTRSAQEVTEQYLQQLEAVEPSIRSFITVDRAGALSQAAEVDRRIADGERDSLGPLAGVPVAIKDSICTRGLQTTAAANVLAGYVPSHDATAVARLRSAGAVLIGKTNLDSFAMGSSTESSDYQVTCNPWDTSRVPGGSSGGSAAAVAGRQCAAALGSDTGGSIRQPAHFCGCVGLKPTYGRVSRFGLIAYGSSLDCIGPLANSVEDAALVLNAIAGSDDHDATSSNQPVPDFAANLQPPDRLDSRPLAGKRIGVIAETMGAGVAQGVTDAVRQAMRHLESLGAELQEVSLPSYDLGLPAYYVIATSEASSNLSRYDGVRYGMRDQGDGDLRAMYERTRAAGLNGEVKRRILMGTYALSAGYYDAYYKRAQQVRTLVRAEMSRALEGCDALLSPVAPTPAYRIGEVSDDPLQMYKGDLMTINVNLAGLPAIAFPCGFDTTTAAIRLPVGLQLIGRAFGEVEIIQMAHAFEQSADFAHGMPDLAALQRR